MTHYSTSSYPDFQDRMTSNSIAEGAHLISQTIVATAEAVSNKMDAEIPVLIRQTPATESPVKVDPDLRSGLQFARFVSDGVAAVAEIAAIANAVAGEVRRSTFDSVVHETDTRHVAQYYNYTHEETEQTVSTELQESDEFTEGWGIIRNGLFNAAQILGNSVTNNAAIAVEHNYGEEAAEATDNVLHIVRNFTAMLMDLKEDC